MPQLFSPTFDLCAKVVITGTVVFIAGSLYYMYVTVRSPYWTKVGVSQQQPVPFSHQHHVQELGIDCRLCHTSAETSSNAGMPDTLTCMTCHSQVWKTSPTLAPIRDSLATNRPIKWTIINDMPQYVYFNHSIHVNKGIGCSSCHGRIDEMPMTWKSADMSMQWCLSCHRNPEKQLREPSEVYQMNWKPTSSVAVGLQRMQARNIHKEHLTDCSCCHR